MLSSPVSFRVPPVQRSGTHAHIHAICEPSYFILCSPPTLFSGCYSRWFKDSRLLTDQEKYQTYSELRSGVLVLVIKNLTERDLGHYECEVGCI